MEELQLIFIPGPGIGHIVSAIEVGKLIVNEDSRLSTPASASSTSPNSMRPARLPNRVKAAPVNSTPNRVELPQVKEAAPTPKRVEAASGPAAVHIARQRPLIEKPFFGITATGARVVGFVVDMYCLTMTEVADEFSIPTYLYFTSGAGFLSFTMFMQRLTNEHHVDITEFRDSNEKLPDLETVTPSILLDRDGGSAFVISSARLIRKTRGIFINTFQELEPNII